MTPLTSDGTVAQKETGRDLKVCLSLKLIFRSDCVPIMHFMRNLPDEEQWNRAVAPTSFRGEIVLA